MLGKENQSPALQFWFALLTVVGRFLTGKEIRPAIRFRH